MLMFHINVCVCVCRNERHIYFQTHIHIIGPMIQQTSPKPIKQECVNILYAYICSMALYNMNRTPCGLYRATKILPPCESMSLYDSQEVLN